MIFKNLPNFRHIVAYLAISTAGLANIAQAAEELSPTVMYQTIDVLASYLEEDMEELAKVTKKTAIVNYTQSSEFPDSVKSYVFKRVEQAGLVNSQDPVRINQCMECLTIRAENKGEEVFIKKGITDKAELKKVLGEMGVRNYLDLNLVYGGQFIALQVSAMDADGLVQFSNEYRTPYNAVNDSQWIIGAGIELHSFSDSKIPSPQAARIYFGQRLFGIGAVGLQAIVSQKADGLSAYNIYSGFFELNHNELFRQYWGIVNLNYYIDLGVSDFNGKQQLTEGIGIKTKFGQYFTLRLGAIASQFMSEPDDDSPIHNPEGESFLDNNEPLPVRMVIGVGIEFL